MGIAGPVLLVFVAASLAAWAFLKLAQSSRKDLGRRLELFSRPFRREEETVLKGNNRPRWSVGTKHSGWLQRVEGKLAQADVPLRVNEYISLRVMTAAVPGLLLLVTSQNIALAIQVTLIGLLIPPIILSRRRRSRVIAFDRQLGEALTTMANSLRAGFGFLQAMELVSKEMPDPLGTEMARTIKEITLGVTVEEALQHLAGRVQSQELDLMITAVSIQRQVGGNLAELLDKIGHTITERERMQGEIRTLTAQGRISGLIIGCLPFVLAAFLIAFNPAYIGMLVNHPIGFLLLTIGVLAEILGIVLIRKIVAIDM